MLRVGREVTPRSLNLRVRQLGKSRRERLRAPPVYVRISATALTNSNDGSAADTLV